MILFLLVGLFLAGASVGLLARSFSMSRARTAEVLAHIDAYGFGGRSAAANAAGAIRTAVDEIASLVGGVAARRFTGLKEAELRNELMAAGLYTTAPRKFLGYRILSTLCVPAAAVWLTAASGFPAVFVVIAIVFAVLVGWTAPMTIVRNRSRRRLAKVDYDLPELIDLLVVTVEAGLGFNGSLQVAAQRLDGPLGDELRLTLQEQSMGLSTNEALKNMLGRSETPAMRSFVRSILQGENLGVSIGEIMRNLAVEMRKRRRAAAEERAQKAPIKILFPLIFLIFPAMFVILLGPAVFQFIEAFGSVE
jgi:tight adherence protein C